MPEWATPNNDVGFSDDFISQFTAQDGVPDQATYHETLSLNPLFSHFADFDLHGGMIFKNNG